MAKILHENEDEIKAVKGKQIQPTISEEEEIDQEESVPSQEPENLSETATAVKQNRNVVIFFCEYKFFGATPVHTHVQRSISNIKSKPQNSLYIHKPNMSL